MKSLLLIVGVLLTCHCSGQMYDKTYRSLEEALSNMDSVYKLDLCNKNLAEIPKAIYRFRNLRLLNLDSNNITTLDGVRFPDGITTLILSHNRISTIRDNVVFPGSLTYLSLSENALSQFDPAGLAGIEQLEIDNNKLTKLPSQIDHYKALWSLKIDNNSIAEMPKEIGGCSSLQYLYADKNKIANMPASITQCKKLIQVYIDDNKLKQLPTGLEHLAALELLSANHNDIRTVTTEFGRMPRLTGLYLNGNKLTEMTNEMLIAGKELDLSNNNIRSVKNIKLHTAFRGALLLIGIELDEANKAHLRRMLPNGNIFYSGEDYENAVGRPEVGN